MKSAMEKGDWSAEIDAATDKGDWSAEIDSQTRDTITASAGASSSGDSAAASTSAPPPPPIGGDDDSGPMVSPFANEVGAAVVEKTAGRSSVTLTIQAAEAALDEVRGGVRYRRYGQAGTYPVTMHPPAPARLPPTCTLTGFIKRLLDALWVPTVQPAASYGI